MPLSSLATLKEEGGAAQLDRHAQRRRTEIDAEVTSGYPLQSAVDDVSALADRILPAGISLITLGEAARVRLRPIVMTLVSTVLGALPLILSTGPGAEARHRGPAGP